MGEEEELVFMWTPENMYPVYVPFCGYLLNMLMAEPRGTIARFLCYVVAMTHPLSIQERRTNDHRRQWLHDELNQAYDALSVTDQVRFKLHYECAMLGVHAGKI